MKKMKLPGWLPSLLLTIIPVIIIWFQGAGQSQVISSGLAGLVVMALTMFVKWLSVYHPSVPMVITNEEVVSTASRSRGFTQKTARTKFDELIFG